MKQLLLLIAVSISINLYCQLDTLTYRSYPGLSKSCVENKCQYFKNGKKIKEADYIRMEKEGEAISECTPCYLIVKDSNGNFLYEGEMYQDCSIGTMIKRHPNGVVSLRAAYKRVNNNNYADLYKDGYCIPDGEWIYYDENGSITKKEIYKEGKLIN